ncbi:MAG: cation-translocating P-type ATPase [Pirellulales bacterium]|nr:cation-translocating P-type ATPase [Pirellulales bacterium]
MIARQRAASPGAQVADLPVASAAATCHYCHLPMPVGAVVAWGRRRAVEPPQRQFCCLGCRLAAEITGQRGEQGFAQAALIRLGLAIFLSLNVMMFTMALWSQDIHHPLSADESRLAASLADLFRYLCLLLSLPVLFLLGGPLAQQGLSLWRRGVLPSDLLILLGVVASYLYSVVSVVRGAGHVYFEVGCIVLVMVTLGRWLEATGKLQTTAALDALERLLPSDVRRVHTEQESRDREQLVPLASITAGDRVRVLAGERIAVDGRIVSGQAAVDAAVLTGESSPQERSSGDDVFAGSLNLNGELLIDVSVDPASSALSRMLELVRTARLSRGRYQRLADRVSRVFLPAVLLVALGALAVRGWQGDWESGTMSALAVLLIACPCALGLATPMAVWAALGTASQAQVLFRSGEALERLASVRAIAFDKTGTITTGQPRVAEFVVASDANRTEALRRASALADGSTHVFAAAIRDFTGQHPTHAGALERREFRSLAGSGVEACLACEHEPTRLGSWRWLTASGLACDASLSQSIDEALRRGESISAIAWQGRIQAAFMFAETLRADAPAALAACEQLGCQVRVLTGDSATRGRLLARELNVAVEAELLPDEKVAALQRFRAEHGATAMVGDGINDAPALAAADLGIALACGADISRESAAVCLLGDDLPRVPWAIALARRTAAVIRQNLFWAFAYNAVGVALAATGRLNPAIAAVAMTVSSALVIGNSLRLRKDVAAATTVEASSAARMAPQPCGEERAPGIAPMQLATR